VKKTFFLSFWIIVLANVACTNGHSHNNPFSYPEYRYENPKHELTFQYDDIAPYNANPAWLVNHWREIDILAEHGVDRQGIAYMRVGPNFYHLSGWDKRRVAQTIDAAYDFTGNTPEMFRLRDWCCNTVVGVYKDGELVLQ
tara:strand:+ start:372 stop:794 length:423 start_codon:yes stop_codon:yes gene_type:complete